MPYDAKYHIVKIIVAIIAAVSVIVAAAIPSLIENVFEAKSLTNTSDKILDEKEREQLAKVELRRIETEKKREQQNLLDIISRREKEKAHLVYIESKIKDLATKYTEEVKTFDNSKRTDFEGIWEGAGSQFNDNQTWTIKLTIMGNKYSINYPSLACGGKLILISRNGNKMGFHENITYGKTKCINNGKTVITKAGNNSVQYDWYYPSGKKGAMGTLTR